MSKIYDKDTDKKKDESAARGKVLVNSSKAKSRVSVTYERGKYVDAKKMKQAKDKAYGEKQTTRDAYTGDLIHRDHNAAERKYKGNATAHKGETDHTVSAKSAYECGSRLPYITDEDVRTAANRQHNFKEISKKNNTSKKEKSNLEYAKDNKNLSAKAKVKLVAEEVKENVLVKGELYAKSAGRESQEIAKTMAGVNLARFINGEKTFCEAAIDTISDTVKGEVTAMTVRSGVNIAKKGMEKVGEQAGKALNKKGAEKVLAQTFSEAVNIVSQNISAVVNTAMFCGEQLKEYLAGNISERDLLFGLGESAICMMTMASCATVGSMAGISIGATVGTLLGSMPGCVVGIIIGDVVGEIIGTAIGYIIGSYLCQSIIKFLKTAEYIKEQERLQRLYEELAIYVRNNRIKFEEYLARLHAEHRRNIITGFNNMEMAICNNDIMGISNAIDFICEQFDVCAEFKTRNEFEDSINDSLYTFVIGKH